MENEISGLHHITAIAGDPQQNYDFYTKILGLRMVKKTVNFDDPKTYHFYFGDEKGTPGTIITFFPWPGVRKGKPGAGMATEISFSVPIGSMDFWKKRFEKLGVNFGREFQKFRETCLPFEDPDGLKLELVIPENQDSREGWETEEIKSEVALKGFHNVTLTLNKTSATANILTDIFGYELVAMEGNLHRYKTSLVENANLVDLLELPQEPAGLNAGGTNHHVAFRVKNEETQMKIRGLVLEKGLQITEKIDRDYFFSLYFREPGGVLFEIATDNPGFTRDESLEKLGSSLKLPTQYEPARKQIEKLLPALKQ